jgi:4-hydroxybenzoate polyprenyltransferase
MVPSSQKPQDALAGHWSDRLPARLRALAQLSRLDRPIGWRLLYMPCLMGIALVRTEEGFWPEDLVFAVLFLIGAIAMRGAGCTYNDIVDAKIDAQVARTAGRPLPSGRISKTLAWAWLGAQCLIGLLVLVLLPPLAQLVALCALPLVAAYPFMKRITWWPQVWLGLTFSWGVLVGASASDMRDVPLAAWVFYAGCVAWTVAYDTIYALQDKEDDALIGVRSTARLFGERWRGWTLGFYVAAVSLWAGGAALSGAGLMTMGLLGAIGALIIWPLVERVRDGDPASALAGFKANQWVGLSVIAALTVEPLWVTLRPLVMP